MIIINVASAGKNAFTIIIMFTAECIFNAFLKIFQLNFRNYSKTCFSFMAAFLT